MAGTTMEYGVKVEVPLPYEQAVERTREALGTEGFGVLTEMDIRAALKKKLDVDFRRYIILGACNPSLAHQALSGERDIGLLLPCNVIVYEADDPEKSVVAAIDPVKQLGLTGNTELEPTSKEVRQRLERVLASISP